MHFDVDATEPGVVEARSTFRLPYEPTGPQRDLRSGLATACRGLVAGPGQILHATYTSADRTRCDLENVLTYNLGVGAIRAAATDGLVLERRFDLEDGLGHRYRYQLAPSARTWAGWRPGSPLCSLHLVAPPRAFANPRAGAWWLHARRGTTTVHEGNATTPVAFLLRISVTPHAGWRGSLASLLKPLADGVVSAMHTHTGSTVDVLPRTASIDPTLTPAGFAHLLHVPHDSALGAVRLVTPWRRTLQWHPADDHIVGLDIRLDTTRAPGTVVAHAHRAESAAE